MVDKNKQQKAANTTVMLLVLLAVAIYVGFYILVANT